MVGGDSMEMITFGGSVIWEERIFELVRCRYSDKKTVFYSDIGFRIW